MSDNTYRAPEVWTWEKPKEDHRFAATNRPVAGPTHDADLPRGAHPFQLYSLGTPNGKKVTIMFEELLAAGHGGAEYDAWYIDIGNGDQFGSGFVSVNPNSKIPALLDCSGAQEIRVFESGAILLHLAEKFGAFLPTDTAGRAECLSWLFWQMSTAPVLGGGFGHFYHYAPTRLEYPINRYAMEAKRIFDVADQRLAQSRFLAGPHYTVADIAAFSWFHAFIEDDAYDGAARFLSTHEYANLKRWNDEIATRGPVQRGLRVNLKSEGTIAERHSAADIDAVMD